MLVWLIMVASLAFQSAATQMRPLEQAEIEKLIPGSFVEYVPGAISEYEDFRRDNSYAMHLDRVTHSGRYRIHSGQLCTDLSDGQGETCRYLFRDSSGKYYVSNSLNSQKFEIRISPYNG